MSDEYDQIFYNSFTGLSSPFLEKQIEVARVTSMTENIRNDPSLARDLRKVMWAGSLHMKSSR